MPDLIVAEKPSVARDIAKVLKVPIRGKGYFQNEQWLITWCIGHLVELVEPHEYNSAWKRWSFDSLPMIPESFRLRPVKSTQAQYEVVRSLLLRKDVQRVVNACDAGREGELIFRNVYELSGCKHPILRLWISSMTEEAISEGFRNLKQGEKYDCLGDAARCRSVADWLVGLNATRAMTLRTQKEWGAFGKESLFSIGRVQTPTLAMIVHREIEITQFVPQDYWLVKSDFSVPAGNYQGKWKKGKKDRLDTEEEAQELVQRLQGHPAEIQKVETQELKEKPPLLFDLTQLQREANKRFGFSASQTLEIAQSLYEKHKVITYPRTDSRFLSSDLFSKLSALFQALQVEPYNAFATENLKNSKRSQSKRIFDDSKVSDHHAIIPTNKSPNFSAFNSEEKKLYDCIVRRFLCVFYPDAILSKTSIVTVIQKEKFFTTGKTLLFAGWKEVENWTESKKKQDNDEESSAELPVVQKGQTPDVLQVFFEKKKTTPPPRYTEASLLAAMEGAGKLLDEEEYQQALKDSGIGTPATRAGIIETLLHRGYIFRKGKSLQAGEKGVQLVTNLPVESLISPQLTGEWEAKLSKTSRGEYQVPVFLKEVSSLVTEFTSQIQSISFAQRKTAPIEMTLQKGNSDVEGSIGFCPHCQGGVVEKAQVFVCLGKENAALGCGFRIFRKVAGKTLTTSIIKKLLEKGETNLLKGFKSKKGSSFDAALRLLAKGQLEFVFGQSEKRNPSNSNSTPQKPEKRVTPLQEKAQTTSSVGKPIGVCPNCKEGNLIQGHQAWGCSRWKEGCQTLIPFVFFQRPLKEKEIQSLLEKGKTALLKGFIQENGQTIHGMLQLVESSTPIRLVPAKEKKKTTT